MNHCGTKQLETKRLILRPFRMEDAEAMFRNWASDPEVTKFLTWPTHKSAEVTGRILAEWIPQYRKDDYYHWAI
ncbi:MAG: GNAT family N-acetyltransferase, partial [Lachnospiraceae bacterium]|nr:GNAT family N-acetyltransferase [Lachnospiraceae bacterium]